MIPFVVQSLLSLLAVALIVREMMHRMDTAEERHDKERRLLEAQIAAAFNRPDVIPVALRTDEPLKPVRYVDEQFMADHEKTGR